MQKGRRWCFRNDLPNRTQRSRTASGRNCGSWKLCLCGVQNATQEELHGRGHRMQLVRVYEALDGGEFDTSKLQADNAGGIDGEGF